MKFKSNIKDLQRVVKPGDNNNPPPPGPPGDYDPDDFHVIDDDQDQDGQDGQGQDGQDGQGQDGQDGQGQDDQDGQDGQDGRDGRGGGKGPIKPVDIKITGNPNPIVDIIPGGKDTSDIKGMDGSDKKGEKPLTREQIKDALEKAQETEATEQRGREGPPGRGLGGRRVAVPSDFPTKTDWARLMINLLNKFKVGPPDWTKIHKPTFGAKFKGKPLMIAGRGKEQDIGKIIVAIDTSGSIDDVIVGGFLSELRKIFSEFKTSEGFACKVILWADGPYAVSDDFKINKFNQLTQWVFSNFVSGGTMIDPVVKLINGIKNLREYVGTVWFTDGQINDLNTKLPNNFNIFVINGFQSAYTKEFFNDLKKFKPSKQITIVKTSYGL